MYLEINGVRHTCSKPTIKKNIVKFPGVKEDPGTVSGIIKVFRDDDFLLAEIDSANFERQKYVGTMLTLTNLPDPVPVDPTTQPEYRIAVLEEENAALREQIAAIEDALCELDMGGAAE